MSDFTDQHCGEPPAKPVKHPKPVDPVVPVKHVKHEYTKADISARFKNYIRTQKPGLNRFYKLDDPHDHLDGHVANGLKMTKLLMEKGCPPEEAAALSVLALWDLVVLVDNSISMGTEESGARVNTLTETLMVTSTIYSFVREKGITAVRFLNTSDKYTNVIPGKIPALMKRVVFEGLSTVGTQLRKKILQPYVHEDMKKPLLVVVLSDAEITGEAHTLLRNVILDQTVRLTQAHPPHGADAVAYQFAKIGNDQGGGELVARLDNDETLGRYIDSMGEGYGLENVKKQKWKILPKLLLGAISAWWDTETGVVEEELIGRDDEVEKVHINKDDLKVVVVEDIFADDYAEESDTDTAKYPTTSKPPLKSPTPTTNPASKNPPKATSGAKPSSK